MEEQGGLFIQPKAQPYCAKSELSNNFQQFESARGNQTYYIAGIDHRAILFGAECQVNTLRK